MLDCRQFQIVLSFRKFDSDWRLITLISILYLLNEWVFKTFLYFLYTNKTAGLHNKYYVFNVQYSFHYSRRLADLREARYQFVYLDETWVNVNHQPSKEWSSDFLKLQEEQPQLERAREL